MGQVADFLLNKNIAEPAAGAGTTAVAEPAFSLTKVLATGATIVTPISALLVAAFTDKSFNEGQIVALALGLLGFLAITTAADVLARGMAAGSKHKAEASEAVAKRTAEAVEMAATTASAAASATAGATIEVSRLTLEAAREDASHRAATATAGLMIFKPALTGRRSKAGPTQPLTIHGLTLVGGTPHFLCHTGPELEWLSESDVVVGDSQSALIQLPAHNGKVSSGFL